LSINFVDQANAANHYTTPPPVSKFICLLFSNASSCNVPQVTDFFWKFEHKIRGDYGFIGNMTHNTMTRLFVGTEVFQKFFSVFRYFTENIVTKAHNYNAQNSTASE